MAEKTAKSAVDWAIENLAGVYTDIEEAAQKLKSAAKSCHLIGGVAIMPEIEGHDIQIVVIPIPKQDCYPIATKDGVPPRRGIPKHTLMTIASAAAVEWTSTERVDDRTDPYYAAIEVKGRYRTIDGSYRNIEGSRDVDLRDGADQIDGKSGKEVNALRANMLRSCETKAKLRALREAFGVAQGMLETELDKPFVFARAVFTGRSSDPATKRMFAQVIALQQLASTAALYGGKLPPLALPSMDEAPAQLEARRARPERPVYEMDDAPPPPPPPAPAARAARAKPGEFLWPWEARGEGDPAKGTPLADVPTAALQRLAGWCDKHSGDGDMYGGRNAETARAARDLLASRGQPGRQPGEGEF